MQVLEDPEKESKFGECLNLCRSVSHILHAPIYDCATGKSDMLLPNRKRFAGFTENGPILDMKKAANVTSGLVLRACRPVKAS